MNKLAPAIGLLFLGTGGLGCGGAAGTDGGGGSGDMAVAAPKFSEVNTKIFKISCTFSSCHDAGSKKGGLDLATDPYLALVDANGVGRDVENPAAKADGFKQVVPGDPSKSFMYKKLILTMAEVAKYGTRMPDSSPPLEADRVDLFKRWIAAGAKND